MRQHSNDAVEADEMTDVATVLLSSDPRECKATRRIQLRDTWGAVQVT